MKLFMIALRKYSMDCNVAFVTYVKSVLTQLVDEGITK